MQTEVSGINKKTLTVKQRLLLMLIVFCFTIPLFVLVLFRADHVSFRQLGIAALGDMLVVVVLLTFITERWLKRKF